MRFPFLELPGEPRPFLRPVVPVEIEDLEEAPVLCLLDAGATSNRMSAELVGISLEPALAVDEIAVAGLRTTGRWIRASSRTPRIDSTRRSGSATRGRSRSGSSGWKASSVTFA